MFLCDREFLCYDHPPAGPLIFAWILSRSSSLNINEMSLLVQRPSMGLDRSVINSFVMVLMTYDGK
jgi:hypothetical protein